MIAIVAWPGGAARQVPPNGVCRSIRKVRHPAWDIRCGKETLQVSRPRGSLLQVRQYCCFRSCAG
jgi:hypothetical protein